MEFCITGIELRKALEAIAKAEANGFDHCLAVFKFTSVGFMLSDCRAEYSDLCERAHPTRGDFDWGRFQGVTRRNRFVNRKLVPIEEKPK